MSERRPQNFFTQMLRDFYGPAADLPNVAEDSPFLAQLRAENEYGEAFNELQAVRSHREAWGQSLQVASQAQLTEMCSAAAYEFNGVWDYPPWGPDQMTQVLKEAVVLWVGRRENWPQHELQRLAHAYDEAGVTLTRTSGPTAAAWFSRKVEQLTHEFLLWERQWRERNPEPRPHLGSSRRDFQSMLGDWGTRSGRFRSDRPNPQSIPRSGEWSQGHSIEWVTDVHTPDSMFYLSMRDERARPVMILSPRSWAMVQRMGPQPWVEGVITARFRAAYAQLGPFQTYSLATADVELTLEDARRAMQGLKAQVELGEEEKALIQEYVACQKEVVQEAVVEAMRALGAKYRKPRKSRAKPKPPVPTAEPSPLKDLQAVINRVSSHIQESVMDHFNDAVLYGRAEIVSREVLAERYPPFGVDHPPQVFVDEAVNTNADVYRRFQAQRRSPRPRPPSQNQHRQAYEQLRAEQEAIRQRARERGQS